jgi:hypothetical protein
MREIDDWLMNRFGRNFTKADAGENFVNFYAMTLMDAMQALENVKPKGVSARVTKAQRTAYWPSFWVRSKPQ